jgi:hypothetical protein
MGDSPLIVISLSAHSVILKNPIQIKKVRSKVYGVKE